MRTPIPLAAALLVASCARPGLPAQPDQLAITYQRAEVDLLGDEGMKVRFGFSVRNPYPLAVDMEPMAYTVELAGGQRVSGRVQESTFEQGRGGMLDIPVTFDWEQLEPAMEAVGGGDAVPFALAAVAVFDLPSGEVQVPLRAEGQLPVLPPPRADIVEMRPPAVGLPAGIELVVAVDGGPFAASRAEYAVYLGELLLSTSVSEVRWSDGRMVLPVALSAPAVAALEQGGLLRLEAVTDVRTPLGVVPLRLDATEPVAPGLPML